MFYSQAKIFPNNNLTEKFFYSHIMVAITEALNIL